jgi:hypothetical protein
MSQKQRCDCCGTGVIRSPDEPHPIICVTCELIASGEIDPPPRYYWWKSKVHTREDVIRKIRQLEIVAELRAKL